MSTNQVVYLKIPVERNGFVDPPKIHWTAGKEQRLWSIISKSKRAEVDWDAISEQLGAPVTFLQQQAFWLYEQELQQLKNRIQLETLPSEARTDLSQSPPTDIHLLNKNYTPKLKPGGTYNQASQTSIPFKDLRFGPERSISPKQQENTNARLHAQVIHPINTFNSDTELASGSDEDEDSDKDKLDQGSMLLQRSRILSKVAPKFKDLEEDETEDYGGQAGNFEVSDTAGSSLSNYSSVSITKSALEEALLNDSNF